MSRYAFLIVFLSIPLMASSDRAWSELLRFNRFEEARTLFESEGLNDDLTRIGWFLTFSGNGPNEALHQAALRIMKDYPESGSAEFVLKWVEPFRECFSDWVKEATDAMAGRQPENPELKILYSNYLRLQARFSEEVPDFTGISQDAGYITNWLFSERFGAYPTPAFELTWDAEKPEYWVSGIQHQSRTGVIIPPKSLGGAGVLYAFSQFKNPVDQDVLLRIFSYQNASLFVDGKLVRTLPSLEEISGNITYLKLPLSAGVHEVMIKTTQTRETNGQFALQVTAPQAPEFMTPGTPTHALSGEMANVEEPEAGLAEIIADSKSDAARFIRAYLALQNKDRQTAHHILSSLFAAQSESILIGEMIAILYLDGLPYLPQEEQLGQAYQIMMGLVQKSEGHDLEVKIALAGLLLRARQTQNALDLLNDILEANPRFCQAIELRLALSARENLLDLREASLKMLEAFGPGNAWAQKALLEESRREGNLEQTTNILNNLSLMLPWDGYLAQKYNMEQNYQAAIADLEKRLAIFPLQDYYPYAISMAYGKLGDHELQREWLEKTMAVNPTKRDALLDLVNLDCLQGKRDDAMKRLRDYLLIEPADAAFRQRLSHLEGATAFETFRVDPMTVIEEAKNKPVSEGADSELLLDQLMLRVFPDGSQMRYTHLVTRVLTKDGVDAESEIRMPQGAEILELRTIKADGSIYYPASFENKDTLSLSGIGVGDFIDEEHIEYLPPAYYDEDGLDADITFIFQGQDRIYHHSEMVLIYPEDLDPEPVLLERNMPEAAEIEVKDGLKYVRWLTQNMPPLKEEENMPPPGFLQPTVSFHYNTRWDEVRDYYLNAIRQRMGLSDRLKEKAAEWRESESDDRKLAEKIYREVTDKVESDGQFYMNVNLVWESSKGNATLLLASIYDELGFDYDLVLTRPAIMDTFLFNIPMPANFSYMILRLQLGDETIWVDPNLRNIAFGYLPFRFRGGQGFVLNAKKESRITLPEFEDETERIETMYEMDFNADGSVSASGSEKFFGSFASQLVDGYAAMNRPETKQRVEAGINQTFPGAEVSQVQITEDLPPGEFELTNRFRLPELGQFDKKGLTLPYPLPHVRLLERYGRLASRTTPIAISRPSYNVATLKLNLPLGYRWESKTDVLREDTAFGRYELVVERESDQTLTIKRTYHLKAQMVAPEQYQEFLVFCRAMVENEDLIFKAVKESGQP